MQILSGQLYLEALVQRIYTNFQRTRVHYYHNNNFLRKSTEKVSWTMWHMPVILAHRS
jgi:hypothetical protein